MPFFTNFRPRLLVINDGLGDVTLRENGPYSWTLLEPFTYTTSAGDKIVVPKNFETDGASSPGRILITSLGGKYSTAALIHDYLYVCLNRGEPNKAATTRVLADAILYEVMLKCQVNPAVALMIWLAVRGFGGSGMRGLGVRT